MVNALSSVCQLWCLHLTESKNNMCAKFLPLLMTSVISIPLLETSSSNIPRINSLIPCNHLFLLQLLTLAQQCYALLSIIKNTRQFFFFQGRWAFHLCRLHDERKCSSFPLHATPQTTIGHCKASQEEGFHHCCLCDQKNAALLPFQCHTPHATIVIERCVLNRFLHILAANRRHCNSSQGRWGFHLHCHLYDPKKCSSPPIPCHRPHATIAIERCGLNRFHNHILAANLRHCKSSWRRWGLHLCHLFCDHRKCSSFN